MNIETIKREILELFLLMDSERQLEVADVLARLVRQRTEMAAGKGVGR
ncbi:MAG: hypothetical protein Q4D98_13800 [Planctomycetia bacterium]|nr:hypothetical protein [Planctomycetia bacterium]MDO4583954.1 hypothetical protein [Planctomycetia bacterium]